MRTNKTYILFICIVAFLCSLTAAAQDLDTLQKPVIPNQTAKKAVDSSALGLLHPQDSIVQDSIPTDSLAQERESILEYNVKLTAESWKKYNVQTQKIYLYNHAKAVYGDMSLEAGYIVVDNKTHEIYAYGITDSTGAYTQRPVFIQGNQKVTPDSIRFNFKTKKALVYNPRTQQGEFRVKAEVTKRVNDSVYYMQHVKFTTSKDIENPEYYFYAQKVKFIPDEKVVSGFVNMYIADVPTPLMLPFAYFPMTSTRTSGFIIPSIGNDRNRGYSFQNGGYYFAINDYLDLAVLGDYYSNGSYGLHLETNYAWRYHFSGNFSFKYEKILQGERGFPDFSEGSIYNIRWSHQQAQKANPNSQFSASVNLGSSKYYRRSFNENNSTSFLNNNMSSSVSYSKSFPGEPAFRFSVTAQHNQNINTGEINMTLPTLDASLSKIYPFAPKNGVKKGIIENINFRYTLRGENRFKTTDSLFFTPKMFKNMKSGIKHSIPINTNFDIFNYLSVNLGGSYEENWLFKTYKKSYDPTREKVVIDTVQGFDSYRTYDLHAGLQTTLYGIFKFGKDHKIQAIRHVIKPSLTYSYQPSFGQFYDTYLVPGSLSADPEIVEYSRFENTLFGAPGKRYTSNISFSLANDFEAKIRKTSDTAETKVEKRKLLSNFRLSTSYDLTADSLNLRPITFSGTLPIIKNKLNINFNGALDPYALNNNNQRINRLNINNGGSLLRLTRANLSFGYSFSSSSGKKKKEEENENFGSQTFENGGRPDDLFGKTIDKDGSFEEEKEKKDEKDQLYRNKMPWNLRIAYTMTYNNLRRQNEISSHSLMFSGDIELSPGWKVGVSSGYDFKNQGFTYTQFRFQRDLKSWQFSFNWTPFGIRESWYFHIGIKASILNAIKYDKRRPPNRRF